MDKILRMISASTLIISCYLLQAFVAFHEIHQNLVWEELEESTDNKSKLITHFPFTKPLVNFKSFLEFRSGMCLH